MGNWKRPQQRWRTWRIISIKVQNAKKLHPAGSEKIAIPPFESKISEVVEQEKLFNTTIPQTPS